MKIVHDLGQQLQIVQNELEFMNRDTKERRENIGVNGIQRVQGFAVKGYYDDYNQELYNGLELAVCLKGVSSPGILEISQENTK